MVNLFSDHLQDYTNPLFLTRSSYNQNKTRGCIKIKPLTASLIQPLFRIYNCRLSTIYRQQKAMLSRQNLTDAVHDNSPIPCQGIQDKQVHPP